MCTFYVNFICKWWKFFVVVTVLVNGIFYPPLCSNGVIVSPYKSYSFFKMEISLTHYINVGVPQNELIFVHSEKQSPQ